MAYPFHGDVYDQVASGTEDLAFWSRCVQAARGSILELGVGTGRLALQLARLSDEYHGLDAEASMLARLQAKMREAGVSIVLHEGSFIDLDLDRQFALVFIPANTISHVADPDDAERFFRAVRQHTAPAGRFVIDTYNPRPLAASAGRYVFARYRDPADGQEVIVYSTPLYDHPSQVTTHRLEYEKSNTVIDTRELRQRSFYPAELTAWLRASGFKHVEHYGSYDESPLEWNSSRLIVCGHLTGSCT